VPTGPFGWQITATTATIKLATCGHAVGLPSPTYTIYDLNYETTLFVRNYSRIDADIH
jgi:hypothetical protein